MRARGRMGHGRHKRRMQVVQGGWTQCGELAPSLRELMTAQEYSATDVGLMFGVSRERVRQWCAQYGIEQRGLRRGQGSRVWDPERMQFKPGTASTLNAERQRIRVAKNRLLIDKRVAERRAYIVEAVRALVCRIRREPTIQEIYRAASGREGGNHAGGLLCGLWGHPSGTMRGVMADLRATCGLPPGRIGRRKSEAA